MYLSFLNIVNKFKIKANLSNLIESRLLKRSLHDFSSGDEEFSLLKTNKKKIILEKKMDDDISNNHILKSNKFECLQIDDEMNNAYNNSVTATPAKTKIRVPPIVISNLQMNDLKQIMKKESIDKYNVKFQSVGIKVFLNDLDDYNKLTNVLKSNNIAFFTFDRTDTKPLKMICSGLPKFELDYIKEEITIQNEEIGKSIIDIKSYMLRHKKFDNELNYVFYLKKGINVNELRKIRAIGNVIVRWKNFVNKQNSPTQCRRCQRFGHGTKNCNMGPRCMFCGMNHLSLTCELSKKKPEDIVPDDLKCPNCEEKHSANDASCAKRRIFIEIRQNMQPKKRLTSANISQNRRSRYIENSSNFPALTKATNNSHYFEQFQPQTKLPLPLKTSWTPQKQASTELFTIEEISHLLSDAIHTLATCKSKTDQFNAIMQLSIKYLYSQQYHE